MRPTFTERTSPEASSTARCCMTAGSDIANGRASLLTELGPRVNSAKNRPAGGIRESLKRPIERRQFVKHFIKYSGHSYLSNKFSDVDGLSELCDAQYVLKNLIDWPIRG